MKHIQQYSGDRVKDGTPVRGYAAIGSESNAAWILVPTKGTEDQFHIVEVKPDSLVPLC